MKLYAVHDVKAAALSSFFAEKSDAVATRNFAGAVLQERSVFAAYPDDFELVSLVEFDEEYSLESATLSWVAESMIPEVKVIVTARQVMDLQPKRGVPGDPAQLALLKEG